MKLRPYQEKAVNAVLNEWESGRKRTLIVMATGLGKTITFANIAKKRIENGERVLVLAHREELLEQAKDKIFKVANIFCAKEKANETCLNSFLPITVGSVQTLQKKSRLERFPKDYFKTIIVDEAHHALADSYQRILSYFENANVLGVTATPERGNKQVLGQYFDSIAYEYTLPQAIKDGYLCKIKAQTIPLKIDLNAVTVSQGDYALNSLGTALDPYLEEIACEMKRACSDRKTVVFLPLVATSKKFTEILNKNGFKAVEVNGNSPDRKEKLKDFENGKYNVICNAMLLTEGWDCPSVDCIVMLRATKIRALYCQCIGRGTRPFKDKSDLLILDFLWHTQKFDLCRPASLICRNEKVFKKMTDKLAGEPHSKNIEELYEEAIKDVNEERENALAEELKRLRNRKRKFVDPLQYALSINDEDLSEYKPTFGWEMKLPTKEQIETLSKFGIDGEAVESKGKASLIINRLIERKKLGMATPKQIRFLERKGFKNVGEWQFEIARKMINRISVNCWRVPRGITPSTYKPE